MRTLVNLFILVKPFIHGGLIWKVVFVTLLAGPPAF